MLTLNGQPLPAPTGLDVRIEPRGGLSQYNTLGRLVLDGVTQKRVVEITWTRMESAALSTLTGLLSAGDFFTLVYPDPLSGSREMRCRAIGQSARVWRSAHGNPCWADVRLAMEEQ